LTVFAEVKLDLECDNNAAVLESLFSEAEAMLAMLDSRDDADSVDALLWCSWVCGCESEVCEGLLFCCFRTTATLLLLLLSSFSLDAD